MRPRESSQFEQKWRAALGLEGQASSPVAAEWSPTCFGVAREVAVVRLGERLLQWRVRFFGRPGAARAQQHFANLGFWKGNNIQSQLWAL